MLVVEWRERCTGDDGKPTYRTVQVVADTITEAENKATAERGRWFWIPDTEPAYPVDGRWTA